MIMENHLITQFPDIILIKNPPTIGDSLSLGVGQAVGTSSTPDLARLPTSIPGV
jgi:hypothetical protein